MLAPKDYRPWEQATMNLPGQVQNSTTQAIEIAIRLGLIFLILAWCLYILSPFISLIVWGGIIAVAIYPLFLKFVQTLGGRKKLAFALVAILMLALILFPVISLTGSMVESATELGTKINEGTLHIPPPSESVTRWPLIGQVIYDTWLQASVDMSTLLGKYAKQLTWIGQKFLGLASGVGVGAVQFIFSLIIAVFLLASADTINPALQKIARRLSTQHGEYLLGISEKTVRSVAVGVIGIAFIQAVLAGIGMMIAGVPAAGLLGIFVLVLAIAQLPNQVVLVPVIIFLFAVDNTTMAIFLAIWSALISVCEGLLKPCCSEGVWMHPWWLFYWALSAVCSFPESSVYSPVQLSWQSVTNCCKPG